MKARITAAWITLLAFCRQVLLLVDQGGNVLLGIGAVGRALWTGRPANVGYADETLSAHAWRSYDSGKVWGRLLMPPIDWLFLWQSQDEEVNRMAGRPVTRHCERAFYKELIRREMPPDYRDLVATKDTT